LIHFFKRQADNEGIMDKALALSLTFHLKNKSRFSNVRYLSKLTNKFSWPSHTSLFEHEHLQLHAPKSIRVRNNTQHRVVLLPEYPGHTEQNNPALKGYKNGLPDFENITEAHCYYGLGQRLMEFESAVCKLESSIEEGVKDWELLLKEIESERLELENMWAIVSLLKIVTDKLDMDRFVQLEKRTERAFFDTI